MTRGEIHQTFLGPAAPQLGWVPAPRFLLRRDRVLRMIRRCHPGRLLEVGCGAGTLLCELTQLGFDCAGLETSAPARELAEQFAESLAAGAISFHSHAEWTEPFDLVTAFEVLEHIEDDESALREWVSWVKVGGQLLLSVPAREARWSSSDVWAGHFRRYEKEQLGELLGRVGLVVQEFECYGFPLSNMVEPVRAYFHRRSLEREASTQQQMTERSGTDRSALMQFYRLYSHLPGAAIVWAACQLQRPFLHLDVGTGYLVLAQRRAP